MSIGAIMRTPTPEQRSLTPKLANELKRSSGNVLCKRSYEGTENEGQLKKRSQNSPLVPRKVGLLSSSGEVRNPNEGMEESGPSSEAGRLEENLAALRLLETSKLVRKASTKNFVARVAQITVTRSCIEGLDLLMAKKWRKKAAGAHGIKFTFTGNPIEQLAQESMEDPTPIFKGSHAEAVLLTCQKSDGTTKVTGQSIHFAIKFIKDDQFFRSQHKEQK